MKALILLPTLLVGLNLVLSASPIKLGQTSAEVVEVLGEPVGSIELRDKTLLLYPQGEVTLRDDRVAELDLMSEAAFQADQERLRKEREEWLIDKERRAAARKEEGEALFAEKTQSSAFAALPAKDRVDYWRRFQTHYPEVDVSLQIAGAVESYQDELEELRSLERIANLEARVAAAEREAAAARLETEKLRESTERAEQRRNYGLRYYTDPVIWDRRHYYRPPTITIYTKGNEHPNTDPTNEFQSYIGNQTPNQPAGERIRQMPSRIQQMPSRIQQMPGMNIGQ